MLILIVLLCLLAASIYKWNHEKFSYFAKLGIPFEEPTFLIGNSAGVILDKESPMELSLRLYKKLKKQRYVKNEKKFKKYFTPVSFTQGISMDISRFKAHSL